MTTTDKDPSIQRLLRQLDPQARRWRVVDHWEADLCAIGIAGVTDPGRLVYISTYEADPDRYHFECEVGRGSAPDDYEVTKTGENVTFAELLIVMEDHLE
ncbi:hypothetical protein L6V77_34720 [Myxococcota bacterium]|nr:hypothetical protein [Myxococcota bacterium]